MILSHSLSFLVTELIILFAVQKHFSILGPLAVADLNS